MEETCVFCIFCYLVIVQILLTVLLSLYEVYSYSLGQFHLCCVTYTDLSTLFDKLFRVCLCWVEILSAICSLQFVQYKLTDVFIIIETHCVKADRVMTISHTIRRKISV